MQRQVQGGRSRPRHTLCWHPPAILVHVCAAAQSAKGPGEVEYKLEPVVIDKYTLSQSHHLSETSEPIRVRYDDNSSKNEETKSCCCLDDAEQHDVTRQEHKSAARGGWCVCF